MTESELRSEFIELTLERSRCLQANEVTKANKAFERREAVRSKLWSLDEGSLSFFKELLDSSDQALVEAAAIAMIPLNERLARGALEKIERNPVSPEIGMNAKMTLKQLDSSRGDFLRKIR